MASFAAGHPSGRRIIIYVSSASLPPCLLPQAEVLGNSGSELLRFVKVLARGFVDISAVESRCGYSVQSDHDCQDLVLQISYLFLVCLTVSCHSLAPLPQCTGMLYLFYNAPSSFDHNPKVIKEGWKIKP